MASEARRYVVKNANSPTSGNVTEEKQSELEEFIGNAKIIIRTLGHKVFEPLISPLSTSQNGSKTSSNDCDELLYFKYLDIEATGKRTSDGFVVLNGSSVSNQTSENYSQYIKKIMKNIPTR